MKRAALIHPMGGALTTEFDTVQRLFPQRRCRQRW
jgi:hypothetical protein